MPRGNDLAAPSQKSPKSFQKPKPWFWPRGEIAFRHRGLEFARARWVPEPGSFRNRSEIVFGLGAEETTLTDRTREQAPSPGYERSSLGLRLSLFLLSSPNPPDPSHHAPHG